MPNITGTSYFFDRARNQMSALTKSADTLQTQISTGKKLTTASDDSAAWQRLQSLVQAKTDATSYSGNLDLARSILTQTDTALGQIQTSLQRANELTIRAKSGTLSASDRAIVAVELKAIADDLGALGQAKDARGQLLFDANAAPIPVADGITVVVNEDPARALGTIASTLASYATTLKTADDATAASASATALDAINTAAANAAATQGAVGARAARLDLVASTAQSNAEVTEQQRSAIEDTDLTSSIADLQKTMTVLNATQASFSKLTELSLFNYLR